MSRLLPVGLLLSLLAACGAAISPEQTRLDRTVAFVRSNLQAIGSNELAALSYQSAIEMGATPVHYLTASMPDNADLAMIQWEGEARPWTVIVRDGPGGDDFVIEAYGETVATPALKETLVVSPRNPR